MAKENKESKENFLTDSGIEIRRVYDSLNHPIGVPGKYPFLRGIQESMYRSKLWTMRQYAGFSTAEEIGRAHV